MAKKNDKLTKIDGLELIVFDLGACLCVRRSLPASINLLTR